MNASCNVPPTGLFDDIPPPPLTTDILPYARDININTKRNIVRRFMIAKYTYGMQETHSILLIQRPI